MVNGWCDEGLPYSGSEGVLKQVQDDALNEMMPDGATGKYASFLGFKIPGKRRVSKS